MTYHDDAYEEERPLPRYRLVSSEDGRDTFLGWLYRTLLAAGDRVERDELRLAAAAHHTERGWGTHDGGYRRLRIRIRELEEQDVIRRCGPDHLHVVRRAELQRRLDAGTAEPLLPAAFSTRTCHHCGRACPPHRGGYDRAGHDRDGYYDPDEKQRVAVLCTPLPGSEGPFCWVEVTVRRRPVGELLGRVQPATVPGCTG